MTSEQFSHQIVTNLFISFLSSYLTTLQKTAGAVAAELTELYMVALLLQALYVF